MNTLIQDLRYGLRMLAKAPGFTTIAVLTLALGIGANTAMFSVINAVVLEPLPFHQPAQLVSLRETESAPGNYPLDGADYLDWQTQNKTFSSMSLYTYGASMSFSSNGGGTPEAVAAIGTQANFFDTLGVRPLLGRTFAQGEDAKGQDHVAILSYPFWQRRFAGKMDAVGKEVQLDGETYAVIGVMPRGFNFPSSTDLWIPFDMTQPMMHNRGNHWALAIGRVKDGVTIEQARADLLTVSARLNKEYRAPNDQDIHSLVFPLADILIGDSTSQLYVLLGTVLLVLLVACANVANLLLARSTGRVREMAVRATMGASRWRIARQLMTESVLLSAGGAALGWLGAWWGVAFLQSATTLPIPRFNPVELNTTVLLFTMGVSLAVGILFGLAPAIRGSAVNLNEELKSSASAVVSGARAGRMIRNTLIVGEIAVSLALLVGAGLLLRSFARLRALDIGVDPHNVLTLSVNLPAAKYKTMEAQRQFVDQLVSRVGAIPGVSSAAASTELAIVGGNNGYVTVPGNTNPRLTNQLVENNYVTPDYFKTFGIQLVAGRTFNQEDMQHTMELDEQLLALYTAAKDPSKVKMPPGLSYPVIINQAMAKAFWPNQDPIGKSYSGAGDMMQRIVVGVARDERQFGLRVAAIPENYQPMTLDFDPSGFSAAIAVKTKVSPAGLVNSVRNTVRDLDSGMAVFHVRTMEQIIAEGMESTTLEMSLLGAFAALAMILAAVGLYGVMSYLVMQRTHEIGVRMALGAQGGNVLRLVMGQGIKLTLLGLAIGIAGAFELTRLLGAMLYGVTARDPLTFTLVAILLAAVSLLACYIPARRAMRVDPMVALRYE